MEQQIWRQGPATDASPATGAPGICASPATGGRRGQGATKKYPDYQESIAKLPADEPTPVPPTAYCYLIMNVDNPTDTAYFLSKNPEALTKLWQLEALGAGVRVIGEINKISHGLSVRGTPHSQQAQRPKYAQPPEPLRHIGGRGYSGAPNIPYAQYRDIMDERDRQRGR